MPAGEGEGHRVLPGQRAVLGAHDLKKPVGGEKEYVYTIWSTHTEQQSNTGCEKEAESARDGPRGRVRVPGLAQVRRADAFHASFQRLTRQQLGVDLQWRPSAADGCLTELARRAPISACCLMLPRINTSPPGSSTSTAPRTRLLDHFLSLALTGRYQM